MLFLSQRLGVGFLCTEQLHQFTSCCCWGVKVHQFVCCDRAENLVGIVSYFDFDLGRVGSPLASAASSCLWVIDVLVLSTDALLRRFGLVVCS